MDKKEENKGKREEGGGNHCHEANENENIEKKLQEKRRPLRRMRRSGER